MYLSRRSGWRDAMYRATLITAIIATLGLTEGAIDPFSFCPTDFGNKTPIYVAGFYTYSERVDGTGRIPAIELAVDHVNNHSDVLRDYHVCVVWRNCRCISSGGIWAFHTHLAEAPVKISLLGPPCSTSTAPVAETAHLANLTTMSYWASSPSLSDREKYPYFFRTFLSETLLNPPKIEIMERFDWRKIGIILHNEEIFTSTQEDLLLRLRDRFNVTPVVQEVFDRQVSERQVERLKESGLRIIFSFMYEDTARYLFCKLYQYQMYGNGYVWLLPGWYADDWWIKDRQIEGCTNEQIETGVVESLYITSEANIDLQTLDDIAISGIAAKDFEDLRQEKLKKLKQTEKVPYNFTFAGVEGFAYDALWAIALSINETAQHYPIENFTYTDVEMGRRIFEDMTTTNFTGVTGSVAFSDGDRDGSSSVEQLQALPCDDGWRASMFYCYQFASSQLTWEAARESCLDQSSFLVSILTEEESNFLTDQLGDGTSSEWFIGLTRAKGGDLAWTDTTNQRNPLWTPSDFTAKDGESCYVLNRDDGEWRAVDCDRTMPFICKRRPKFRERIIFTHGTDGSLSPIEGQALRWHGGSPPPDHLEREVDALSVAQYAVIAVLACLGLAVAIFFLIFNIIHRHHKFVKLSSPRLNNVIIAGAILIYVSIIILWLEIGKEDSNEKRRMPVSAFCMIYVWLILISIVLSLGALFSKTWRVYKVANIKGVKSVKIKDSELFIQVGIFLLIGIIILIIWTLVDPLEHEKAYTVNSIEEYTLTCTCDYFTVWAVILILYIGVILVFGVFLAWHTRKVSIPALNDSKLIGICIYNITILFAVTIGVCATIPDSPSFRYVFISSVLNFCASFTVVTIFLPKVIFVYRYPDADRKAATSSNPSHSHASSSQHVDEMQRQGEDVGSSDGVWTRIIGHLRTFTGFSMESSSDADNGIRPHPPKDQDGTNI